MLKIKSEFNKNVATLISGTAVAQAIPIAISPILTRIYTPEDFGVFALFVAIISILGNIANARYELAIMLPKKDEDAINVFALGFIITCIISTFLFFIVWIFNEYLTSLLGNEEISFWLYFIPIAIFFSGLYNILNYFNNRKKNYKDLRNATILKSVVLAIIQLSIGFIKAGASGLILGQLFSNIFANMKLLRNILQDKVLISKISIVKMIALSKKYKNFPKHNLFSTLSNNITTQIPFFMIPKIFDLSISGYFFFAQRIVFFPSSLMANSISQVFFQKVSENIKNNKKNLPLFFNTFKKLTAISLTISIIIYLFSPIIFETIFGKNWIISGEISQYLALTFFITFVASTMSISLISYNKLKLLATWQYLYLCSSIILFFISYYCKFELSLFLKYYAIHQFFIYIIYLYIIFSVVYKADVYES